MTKGCRVEVTGGFLLMLAWLNYTDVQGLLPAALCAATAHELGHWLAISLLGGRVTRLRLSAVGAEMRLERTMSYFRELLCALAGPAVNILLAIGTAWLCGGRGLVFAGMNLALGLFNLLPVRALDGGRSLFCVSALCMGIEYAQRLGEAVDRVILFLLLLAAVIVLKMGGSVTLLAAALWMFFSGVRPCRKKGLSKGV